MKKRDWSNKECRRLIDLVSASNAGCVTPDMVQHFSGRTFNSLQSQWNRIRNKSKDDFPKDPVIAEYEAPATDGRQEIYFIIANGIMTTEQYDRMRSQIYSLWPAGVHRPILLEGGLRVVKL